MKKKERIIIYKGLILFLITSISNCYHGDKSKVQRIYIYFKRLFILKLSYCYPILLIIDIILAQIIEATS